MWTPRRAVARSLGAKAPQAMSCELHRIVQHAADAHEARIRQPIDEKMSGPLDESAQRGDPLPAMAEMVAADPIAQFRPNDAAGQPRVGSDVAKTGRVEDLIAPSRDIAEMLLGPGKNGQNVVLGRRGKPEAGHLSGAVTQASAGLSTEFFDNFVELILGQILVATLVDVGEPDAGRLPKRLQPSRLAQGRRSPFHDVPSGRRFVSA